MNLQDMRASFKRRTGGLADGLSDGDVDKYLNHAYQHTIPDLVPGQLTDGVWSLTTIALTDTYAFPDYVHSVRPGLRIGDSFLDLHDRERDFWLRYDPTSVQTAEPDAVLNYGRSLQFRPTPNAEYTVSIPARLYPNAAGALLSLTANGLAWYTHANAVIWHGLVEFAEDYDLTAIEARAEAKAGRATSMMTSRGLARSRRRRPRMTF